MCCGCRDHVDVVRDVSRSVQALSAFGTPGNVENERCHGCSSRLNGFKRDSGCRDTKGRAHARPFHFRHYRWRPGLYHMTNKRKRAIGRYCTALWRPTLNMCCCGAAARAHLQKSHSNAFLILQSAFYESPTVITKKQFQSLRKIVYTT